MTTLSMRAVAVSDTEARFAVRVATGPVRIAYATTLPVDGQPMDAPAFSTAVAVDAQGAAKVAVTGLAAETRYWWRVEDVGVVDNSHTGTFLTPPAAGTRASYTITASGDAGLTPETPGATGTELLPDRISNHDIHALIAERMRAEDWLAHIDMGDTTYYNFGDTAGGFAGSTLADYRRGYNDLDLQPNQADLLAAGSYVHVWDDHEYGPNNSDGTHVDKANAAQVFREREPHHDLPDTGGIWRSFRLGRVEWVIWDCRYHRSSNTDPDGPGKTMLGATQRAWFNNLMNTTDAEVIVIVSSVEWVAVDGTDSWPSFGTERQEIADYLESIDKARRIVMISADAHKVGIDTGAHNAWGGWPCAVFAARDATPSAPSGQYDLLEQGGRSQYGTVTVNDLGSVITVKLTAWQGTTELGSYTKAFETRTPTVTIADIPDLVAGSHLATFEARVMTSFQTGADPNGTVIPILSGDVQYDASADVYANANLETMGITEDYAPLFPRFPDDLLAPYGNEVFLRRGIDTGADVLWVPLGYFRLSAAEQANTSDSPIRLGLPDRMQHIIDSKLVQPRQYHRLQTVAAVVFDLLFDLYPEAIVLWDDDSEQAPIGRDLVVEQDRYAALRDIATSRGKVIYWDSEGILRFEDPPDPGEIVWDIAAGRNGVLVDSARRVTREGMANGVAASGEGTSEDAVTAIAVDTGPNSPTRWGGRFGKIPRFYSSPLITSASQALQAATTILRRSIGMPYSADFGTVANPALRPRHAIRVTQKDGTREKHIVETLVIPLDATAAMTGTTREQTLMRTGSLLPTVASPQPESG